MQQAFKHSFSLNIARKVSVQVFISTLQDAYFKISYLIIRDLLVDYEIFSAVD